MNVTEEQTTDTELIARVRARYGSEMSELQSLGFREFCFHTESLGQFSALTQFPYLLAMRSNNEVIFRKPPLRIAAAFPLLAHAEFGAYAQPMGMGIKFYTRFTDDVALITCNFVSQDVNVPRLRKFGRPQPLQWAWLFHQKQIEQMRAERYEIQTRLSFDDYRFISKLEMIALPGG